jgi:hypothetical protein
MVLSGTALLACATDYLKPPSVPLSNVRLLIEICFSFCYIYKPKKLLALIPTAKHCNPS